MNIYDISQKTGVSIATVSRVINGSSSVSDKTRAKVLAAIEESGYTPNVFARGLGLNTMKTIGILCADSSDPYHAQAVYYLEEGLRKNSYDAILSCTGFDHSVKEKCMNMILSKRVDAVILVGSNYAEENDELNGYIRNAAKTVPVMLINGTISAPNIYCTVCDDYAAVYEITDKMISSGRKNPLYIYNSTSYSGKKKLSGFRAALKDNGLEPADSRMLFVKPKNASARNISAHEIRDTLSEAAAGGMKFDCVVTSDDILAVGVLKYAKAHGLSVPKDIAVAGYNNFDISECCDPELTSVDNRLEALCSRCVSTLMELFAGADYSIPKKTVFSCEIVERETTNFKKRGNAK